MNFVSLDNGTTLLSPSELSEELLDLNWEALSAAMDDEIREEVHAAFAPCGRRVFLERYLELAGEDLII